MAVVDKIVTPLELKKRISLMCHYFKDLSCTQKTLVLKSLFPLMEGPQFHWLGNQIGNEHHAFCPPGCQDILKNLPIHLTFNILKLLDPTDLARASQVCVNWRELCDSKLLWHRLCFLRPWRLSPSGNQEQLNRQGKLISWKRVFVERFKLRRSWLSGQCHVRTFEGHTGGVSCIQMDAARIVSGSHDKTIRVWNIKTNSPWSVMTLTGHSGQVRCLHLDGNRLVSGSADSTIKVWDLDIQPEWSSIGCKVTMVGHTDKVRCVLMNKERKFVVSGSYDHTIKIWCLSTGNCLRTLRDHNGPVLCLHWNGRHLVSGSADKTIKVWTIEGTCLQTLEGHKDAVTCISRESDRLITGSLDRTIKLWNLKTGDCISTLDWMSSEGHTGVIRCLQADDWRIVSAADDKMIKVWCLESGQRLVTLQSHTDGVTCLQFNDFVIASGSYDKTVKLWDFTVC